MANGNFDPAPGDGMFTTFSKYGLLGCALGVIALIALRSQKADSIAHADAMAQLYVALENANERAAKSEEASRVERKETMVILLGVKTEAAAAKTAATALKSDVGAVKEGVAAVKRIGEETKKAVDKIE